MSYNSPLNKIAAQTGSKRTYEVLKKQVDPHQSTWSKCQYLQLSHCKNTTTQYNANDKGKSYLVSTFFQLGLLILCQANL